MEVVPELPPDLGVPVFMVQHMPQAFTASFAARLAQVSRMPVVEARAGDTDGADAMARIRRAGGYGIAESEETAVVWGMPKEAVARGGADIVLPSYRIAGEIVRMVRHWQG